MARCKFIHCQLLGSQPKRIKLSQKALSGSHSRESDEVVKWAHTFRHVNIRIKQITNIVHKLWAINQKFQRKGKSVHCTPICSLCSFPRFFCLPISSVGLMSKRTDSILNLLILVTSSCFTRIHAHTRTSVSINNIYYFIFFLFTLDAGAKWFEQNRKMQIMKVQWRNISAFPFLAEYRVLQRKTRRHFFVRHLA